MQNIIEISQMDDLLESFFNDDKSMNIVVGGMAGTDIFRQVMDTATTVSIFEKNVSVAILGTRSVALNPAFCISRPSIDNT